MIRVPLTRGFIAIVDNVDARLAKFRWFANEVRGRIYARRSLPDGGTELLHRAVLQVAPKIRVDHILGNGLDCRRKNLRVATNAQNLHNRGKQSNNTSGFKGVSRLRERWRATIQNNGRWQHLGVFNSREEAARAYDRAAARMHGKFARLNFPRS